MDQIRTGELIRQLRTNKGLTHAYFSATRLYQELAEVLGTDVGTLLSGTIDKNESEKGNMKKLKFYVCTHCGNVITSTSDANVSCCGSRLTPLDAVKAQESEMLTVEEIDNELFVSSEHEMTKEHYISFVAYQNDSTVMMFKQYPEWNLQVNMPRYRTGRLVWYCTKCGLLYQDIRRKPSK